MSIISIVYRAWTSTRHAENVDYRLAVLFSRDLSNCTYENQLHHAHNVVIANVIARNHESTMHSSTT